MEKLLFFDWLGDVSVHPEIDVLVRKPGANPRGDCDDRQLCNGPFESPDRFSRLNAIHRRHLHVHQYQVYGSILHRPQGFAAIPHAVHMMPRLLQKRRVVAKIEWHPDQLYPTVGFIVTDLSRPAERVVAFYNHRATAEQWIKEGKNAVKWTRLSCRKFRNNEVRLQLHALAYNLANFMRTLALPEAAKHWSLTSLRQKLVKIGARIVGHGRYVTFQMAEVAVPRGLFDEILRLIAQLRAPPTPA